MPVLSGGGQQVETVPGRRVLSGELPGPILSSRQCGWDEVVVELYSFRRTAVTTQSSDHVVSVHLAGRIDLLQRRSGRQSVQTVAAGDTIITPVGEPKRWEHDAPVQALLLRLSAAYLEGIAAQVGSGRFDLLDDFGTRDPRIFELARRLLSEFRATRFADALYAESLGHQLAVHLLQHYSTLRVNHAAPAVKLPRHKLNRAIEFIDENLRGQLTLRNISAALAMSPCHFAHMFKQTTGLSPHRYVTERRIDHAKSLLRETRLPVAEIALQVGYGQLSHFSVAFHNHTGLSPKSFRERI